MISFQGLLDLSVTESQTHLMLIEFLPHVTKLLNGQPYVSVAQEKEL